MPPKGGGNAFDRFNANQAKQLAFAQPGPLQLGRKDPIQMGGPMGDTPAPAVPTQSNQRFMGGDSRFQPMGGAQRPAPRPVQQPHPQEMAGGDEETVVEIYGVAPDGTELFAPFSAVFPRGSKILGVIGMPPGSKFYQR